MKPSAVRIELTPTAVGARVKLECRGGGKIFREATEITQIGNLGAAAAAWVSKTLKELGFEVEEPIVINRPQPIHQPKMSGGLRD
jgi:hypothetical protein